LNARGAAEISNRAQTAGVDSNIYTVKDEYQHASSVIIPKNCQKINLFYLLPGLCGSNLPSQSTNLNYSVLSDSRFTCEIHLAENKNTPLAFEKLGFNMN
jgi:hypothetical protein